MGKWCLHASLFLGNKDMFKNYKRLISGTFRRLTLEVLSPEKKQLLSYLKTIQIFNDFTCWLVWNERMLAHWTQVSDRCPLGCLSFITKQYVFYSLYNTVWIAKSEICLDPKNSVIKRLWCSSIIIKTLSMKVTLYRKFQGPVCYNEPCSKEVQVLFNLWFIWITHQ